MPYLQEDILRAADPVEAEQRKADLLLTEVLWKVNRRRVECSLEQGIEALQTLRKTDYGITKSA